MKERNYIAEFKQYGKITNLLVLGTLEVAYKGNEQAETLLKELFVKAKLIPKQEQPKGLRENG